MGQINTIHSRSILICAGPLKLQFNGFFLFAPGVHPHSQRRLLSVQLLPLRHDALARDHGAHEERARSQRKVNGGFDPNFNEAPSDVNTLLDGRTYRR